MMIFNSTFFLMISGLKKKYWDGWIPGQTEDIKEPQHQKRILKKYKESMPTIIANFRRYVLWAA